MTDTHTQAFPQTVTHHVGDVVITFKPLVVKTLGKFAQAIKPIMADPRIDEVFALSASDDAGDLSAAALLQDMAGEYSDQLTQALMACSDVDVAWLEQQDIDVLINLAQKAVEVNRDYFLPRIAPRLLQAILAVKQTGQTSAVGLSQPDTGTTTLQTTP